MADEPSNPLLSNTHSTETSPHVQLHPLVLLTISDYITRHSLRQQDDAVIGAIIGAQNGREVTMEAAFQCKSIVSESGDVRVDPEWFDSRLEQFKTVYSSPQLDFVGWFTLGSTVQPFHVPIHEHFQSVYNETALLLLFHPTAVHDPATAAGKLPLTIYESVTEGAVSGGDKAMEVDGPGQQLKFRELSYSVETGEAEMISVDYVARGGGNATAVVDGANSQNSTAKPSTTAPLKGKGKAKVTSGEVNGDSSTIDELTPGDEELIAALSTKANAIRMLQRRIQLMQSYLTSLPPCYLTDASIPVSAEVPQQDNPNAPPVNHQVLRAISALLARLPLLVPPSAPSPLSSSNGISQIIDDFSREALEEKSDVQLVDLLSSVSDSVSTAKEAGRRWAIVESARHSDLPRNKGRGPGGGGAMDSDLASLLADGSLDSRIIRERMGKGGNPAVSSRFS